MLLIFLILSLISLTSAGVTKELCTPDQVQSMKEKQSSCTSKILDKLMSIDSLQPSEVCKIINETALGCTQSFGQCQVHEEVKAMDEHQWKVVSELFAKNDPIGKLINECQMIKDLDFKEGIKCDQDAVLNTTDEYHTCIDEVYHNLSLRLIDHQTYPGMALNNLYDLFCDGMKDVMSTCTWILTKCFGRKDMIEKRNRYMRLLQSIFMDTMKVSYMTFDDEATIEMFQCKHLADVGYQRSSSSWLIAQNKWMVATIILVLLI